MHNYTSNFLAFLVLECNYFLIMNSDMELYVPFNVKFLLLCSSCLTNAKYLISFIL
jgi:hypothetical protein